MSVDVDLSDIMDEIDDDDLRAECESRGILPSKAGVPPALADKRERFGELADDLRAAFAAHDRTHFEVLLLRLENFAGVPPLTIVCAKEPAP